ncbi:MAG: tryptophan 2,3-dioxygenase family protein [Bacteroidia bacterium]|nr:tryptophan 2,3-dioxygenase family protein [Bacteroidia bacterium]MDW8235281.1 tryptophan 2,3-dioxygenase family protein [Bacteroidia bacterium]
MQDKLDALRDKYSLLGQDMETYLEGLLYSRSLTYWDYIELDTLLTLQKPRTDFPDEVIFIVYHQITELYFRLAKQELQLIAQSPWEEPLLLKRLGRVTNYFQHLTHSFEIMIYGMESHDFLRFRTALMPASGFQSVQFREIELYCTGLENLLAPHQRGMQEASPQELYKHIYWKYGNLDARTQEKTLTLRIFEQKYDSYLLSLALEWREKNLNARLLKAQSTGAVSPSLRETLRELDVWVNLYWKWVHLRTAAHYLRREEGALPSTGGTNWQSYLPPLRQKIWFFPSLWSAEEKEEWGKGIFLERFRQEVESCWRRSRSTTQ